MLIINLERIFTLKNHLRLLLKIKISRHFPLETLILGCLGEI